MYWRKFLNDEQGKFTLEAMVICIFIVMVTMMVITSVMAIFENVHINRQQDKIRYGIEAFNVTLSNGNDFEFL